MVTKVKPFGKYDIVKKGESNDEEFVLENARIFTYPENGKVIVKLMIDDKVAAIVSMKVFGAFTSPVDRWQTAVQGKRRIAEYFLEKVDSWKIPVRDKAVLAVLLLNVVIWSKYRSRRGKNDRSDVVEQKIRNDLRAKVKLYRDTLLPKETN